MVRKYTPRELRQKKATIKFMKTFIGLSLLFAAVTSLPSLINKASESLSRRAGIDLAGWRIKEDEQCGLRSTSLSERMVVITGGNSGVGYAAALALSKLGATVVLGCRR